MASQTLSPMARANLLLQAVSAGLREPRSAERNARLETLVDEPDRTPAETFDLKPLQLSPAWQRGIGRTYGSRRK